MIVAMNNFAEIGLACHHSREHECIERQQQFVIGTKLVLEHEANWNELCRLLRLLDGRRSMAWSSDSRASESTCACTAGPMARRHLPALKFSAGDATVSPFFGVSESSSSVALARMTYPVLPPILRMYCLKLVRRWHAAST